MSVLDRIAAVGAPNEPLTSPIKYIVVHHTSLSVREARNPEPVDDDELDVVAMGVRFCGGPMGAYTGNRFPYHLVVRRCAVVEQALPLDQRGAHAVRHNDFSLGVAYVGEHGCSTQQYRALVRVCRALVLFTRGASIVGHSSGGLALPSRLPPEASSDPQKVCPAASFDIAALRHDVMEKLDGNWRSAPREHVDRILRAEGYAVPLAREVVA